MITTEAELRRLEPPDRWAEQIREALVWGSDRTDRFQSVARWRGEASPKIASVVGEEPADRVKLPPGWSAWRFAGPSWPGSDSFVRLVDVQTRIVTGWIVAATVHLGLGVVRTWLAFFRYPLLTATMALSICCELLLPVTLRELSAPRFTSAALSILIVELGRDSLRSVGPRACGKAPG